jgi:phage gp29-like protein
MAQPNLKIAQPITQPVDDGALAPWPSVDKYPVVIGPGLSLNYISAIFRLSLVGYRQQYVDLLDEMLEKDPHAFSVLSKRALGVAGGRVELTPARRAGRFARRDPRAGNLRRVQAMLDGIPDLASHLASLAWASYYGIEALETHWVRDGSGWFPDRLSFIHSRRLGYPAAGSWDLYVWDQGEVLPGAYFGQGPTNRKIFGLRIADAPGKFIIHAPQVRGDYPTREGLGRQIAYWMALKLIATRAAPQYLQQFAKPLPEGTYATGPEATIRPASQEDIDQATAALNAMGAGSLTSWMHADTIKLALRTPDTGSASKLTFGEWIQICDGQISKAVLGGTLTTDVGSTGGNRSLGETQKKGEMQLLKHDAGSLASSLKRDLISWIVRLNFPKAPLRLVPNVAIRVEESPDPMLVIEKAAKGASAGMPIDADAIAAQTGLPLIKPGDINARRMVPIAGQKSPGTFDADLAARERELAPPATAESDEEEEPIEGEEPDEEEA